MQSRGCIDPKKAVVSPLDVELGARARRSDGDVPACVDRQVRRGPYGRVLSDLELVRVAIVDADVERRNAADAEEELRIAAASAVALIGMGLAALVSQVGTNTRLSTKVDQMTSDIQELKSNLNDGTRSRYTSEMATLDRKNLQDEVNVWVKTVSGLIEAQVNRNNQQDQEILRLSEFKARVEERMKMGDKP